MPLPVPRLMRLLAIVAALGASSFGGTVLVAQAPPDTSARPALDSVVAVPDSLVRDSTEADLVARRFKGTIRTCYQEQGLKSDPALRGLLRVDLTVLAAGTVQAAAATATAVSGSGMPAVAACVSTAARTWRFSDGMYRTERVALEFDLRPPTP